MKSNYECVVVGGGPAGCSAAAIVAEAGFDTLLIEREAVPRFHVGESLMPETYWPLERLGLNDRIRSSGWQVKKSVQFVTHGARNRNPSFFRQHDDRHCSTPGKSSEVSSTKCCSTVLPNWVPSVLTVLD